MPDNDDLDKLLNRWDSGFRPDSELQLKVLAQSARRHRGGTLRAEEELGGVFLWLRQTMARPGLAASFAAVFLLTGMGISQLIPRGASSDGRDELTLTYRLSIDPLYRLQAVAGVGEVAGVEQSPDFNGGEARVLSAGLGWLQGELDLSEPQYRRVSALHGDYEMAFDQLFVELLESHRQYKQLDRKRMSNDVIDYFELYELLQNQKRLSEQSARLTEELLEGVSQIIDPQQRERYKRLLNNVYPSFAQQGRAATDV